MWLRRLARCPRWPGPKTIWPGPPMRASGSWASRRKDRTEHHRAEASERRRDAAHACARRSRDPLGDLHAAVHLRPSASSTKSALGGACGARARGPPASLRKRSKPASASTAPPTPLRSQKDAPCVTHVSSSASTTSFNDEHGVSGDSAACAKRKRNNAPHWTRCSTVRSPRPTARYSRRSSSRATNSSRCKGIMPSGMGRPPVAPEPATTSRT